MEEVDWQEGVGSPPPQCITAITRVPPAANAEAHTTSQPYVCWRVPRPIRPSLCYNAEITGLDPRLRERLWQP